MGSTDKLVAAMDDEAKKATIQQKKLPKSRQVKQMPHGKVSFPIGIGGEGDESLNDLLGSILEESP